MWWEDRFAETVAVTTRSMAYLVGWLGVMMNFLDMMLFDTYCFLNGSGVTKYANFIYLIFRQIEGVANCHFWNFLFIQKFSKFSKIRKLKLLHIGTIDQPATAWGGGRIRPPRFLVDNLRLVADIDAKLGIPFRTSILRYHAKFWTILPKTFWVIPIFVTQCHDTFGHRKINVQKISKNQGVKQNANGKKKGVEWTGFQNGYLGFSK